MNADSVQEVFAQLDKLLRKASIAEIGGFQPPDDPLSSWFGGHAVSLPDEAVPDFAGKLMFPLLQINCSELPYLPEQLSGTELLVVWLNQDEIPFDKSNDDGWLIREYKNLEGLRPVPDLTKPSHVKTLPIRWSLAETEGPGWEEAWGLVDLNSVNASEKACDEFFAKYSSHPGTKVGGYPTEIQHGISSNAAFVFQIGSEEKPNWMWVDNGIAYFLKTESGEWEFQCQFY
ncbi:MAG: DUF1963 domain-containing protein [Verrucomicrobia bacterium]|nr:DUF1963 domain-containing protein [Verrucomicrobiota bacterium]MCH8513988.1 DUF1963 domain-containing protein [Kiritimatiellia bacterium]